MERGRRPVYRILRWHAVLWPGALLALLLQASLLPAVERGEEFVEALRQSGMHDMALAYLDRMQTSRLAGKEFQQLIPYHRGLTLIEQARGETNAENRNTLLEAARDALDAFAEANPERSEGAEARGRLGSLLVQQAKQLSARAEQLPPDRAERISTQNDARRLLDDAQNMFRDSQSYYRDVLAKFPKNLDPKKERDKIALREEHQGRLVQLQMLVAQTDYEKARTYPEQTGEFQQLNEQAAEQFAALFEKYSSRLVGYYALRHEGLCYQALGNYKKALGCYGLLVDQSSANPAFRKLISTAHQHQAECFIAQENYDAAIAQCQQWLKEARRAEKHEPEWLAVQFRLAEAQRAKAESMGEESPARRNLLSKARDLFRDVARAPGEFQQPASDALAALGPGRATTTQTTTFVESFEAGKDALNSVQAAQLAQRVASENTPTSVADLQAQAETARADALRLFSLALEQVDDETDIAQLNQARYFLCWLYYQQQDYYRSAVLGEFVSRRYSAHPAAAMTAKLAMASYEQLYQKAVEAGQSQAATEFEAQRLAEMAEFITRRWPGTKDAEVAFSVLLNFAMRHDRLEEAKAMLEEVSPKRRTEMELKLGGAIWGRYLELSSADDRVRPDPAERNALRREAVTLLETAIASARKSNPPTEAAATAALYLAQAHLSQGEYQQAIDMLRDPQLGPLTLVEQGHDVEDRKGFSTEAYKAALRAYVSVTPPQGEQALAVMEDLEQSIGNEGQAADRLTQIYVSLGQQMQRQIEDLQSAGRSREAARVVDSFSEFLGRVATRDQGANWASRSWIAQSYFSMGEALDGSSGNESAAREHFGHARDAYRQLIDQAEQQPDFSPSEVAVLAAQLQLGQTLRRLGEFKESLDTFSAILKDHEAQLEVQKAAAYTYQERGTSEHPQWLERAIGGGYRLRSTGKNRIWGWVRLAQVVKPYVRSNPERRETFFEAWLNTARCRYLIAMRAEGTDRVEDLNKAKTIVRAIVQHYPDLISDDRRAKFDQLTKEIQSALGEQPVGLKEFTKVAQGR